MTDKIAVELGKVQITLLLPLYGRMLETKKNKPLLKDETAVSIISQIDYDFTTIAQNIHPMTQFEWMARSIHIDRTIREFLEKHPRGTVVNVGCGLDTTFDRVDNGSLFWYDLDLPDVIELRRKFITENERRKFISCSFLDESWFSQIHIEDNILFMAAGVLYYLEESALKEIFHKLSCNFPSGEFIFDAASRVGVKIANEKLIQKIGLDEKSFMRWGIQKADEMLNWDAAFEYVKDYLMFKKMRKGLTLRNKLNAFLFDHYKMMYMIHLKFSGR